MTPETFRFDLADGVGTLTLDRPKVNALTFASYQEMRAFFVHLQGREDVRALVVTGAGKHFCGGGDREDIIGRLFDYDMAGLLRFTRITGALIQSIRELRKPVVAAVSGAAVGAGAVIALACDIRIVSETARFGFVFPQVGLSGADMGATYLLPRVVGLGHASELLFTGDIIDAQRAATIGLANRVVPVADLATEANAFARRLADGPAFAHAMTKQMLEAEAQMTLADAIEAEAQAQAICMEHPDFREAYDARKETRIPLPLMFLSSDDLPFLFEPHHADVEARVRGFCHGWTDAGGDDAARTRAAVEGLADAGLLALCVPAAEETLDVRALTLVREGLGQVDGLLDFAFAMQGLGSCPIRLAGTPEQQARYLPGIAAGQRIGAFALTEPDAGSDVASLACRATPDGDGWRLDGEKTFISNAGLAHQYVVFATVDPALGRKGITAFLVEPDDPGFSVEPFEVIAPHPIGTLRFEGCSVSGDRRLGEVGAGFRLAMQTLDRFRNTVAGAALGMARRALDEALDFATTRTQFGKALIDHQQVAAYLADSATELDAARLLVYRAAWAKDTREGRVSQEVAMGKLYATEAAQRIIDRAVQIHGGRGVMKGVAVERLYREIRALRIYEGTSEIQRVVIAAGLRRGR